MPAAAFSRGGGWSEVPRGDDGREGLEVLEESDGGFFFLLLGGVFVCVGGV